MTTSPRTNKAGDQGPFDIAALTALANQLFREDAAPAAPRADAEAAAPAVATIPTGGVSVPSRPASLPGQAAPAHQEPHEQYQSGFAGASSQVPRIATITESPNPVTSAERASQAFYFLDHGRRPTADAVATVPVPGPPLGGALAAPPFDQAQILRDFPILRQRVNGKRLVWLDNAATTQKPRQVVERLQRFYYEENSNIHRAAHALAARATDAYEGARSTVARFLNAASAEEIVFVRGATEAINLVANTWGKANVGPGDEIVVSLLEHHANIVPWQMLCAEVGARIRVIPVDDRGQILLDEYAKLLGPKTKLVAFTHVSNALGTVTPAQKMITMARHAGIRTLLDGAQSVSHMPIDVQALGCDFFVLSGHKVFAPTGIGVLFGRREVLQGMPPWQGGGNMIDQVSFEHTTYQPPPARFEAGTGNIADAVGLGAALDYISQLGMETISRYEHQLLVYGTRRLQAVPGLRLIGTATDKASVLSFTLEGWSNAAVGTELDRHGIAVRSGHHCAQPILRRLGLDSSVRPSLAFYNTCADIDLLVMVLEELARHPKRG